jgi:hypothetical protein
MTPIELIDAADFSDHDRDMGTAGFCAMFALALYRAMLDQSPTLVLVSALKNGEVLRVPDGGMWWCHAAVKIGDHYYDIEGEQLSHWMINNYAWAIGPRTPHLTATLIELPARQFVNEIRTTHGARDWRFYTKCKNKFSAIKDLPSS